MLHHLKWEGTFVIYSDASDYTIGSILYEKDSEGRLQVIAYVNSVQRNRMTLLNIRERNTCNCLCTQADVVLHLWYAF